MNIYNIYKKYLIEKIKKEFNYNSIMNVPYIYKITINSGIGNMYYDKKLLNQSLIDISNICGQKGIITKSKKSISNFKIRENYPVGIKVTLRKFNMWSFIDRLIYIYIPRIRDFRGLSKKSFDKSGNYNIGIKDKIIFPEIKYNINTFKGLDINISIRSEGIKQSLFLLKSLYFPFK